MPSALEKLREIRSIPSSLQQEDGLVPLWSVLKSDTEYTELQNLELPAVSIPPAFNPAASAALRLVAFSEAPVPHPQIVRMLAEQGYSKPEAYKGIAHCQASGWVLHNLTTGYILPALTDQADGG